MRWGEGGESERNLRSANRERTVATRLRLPCQEAWGSSGARMEEITLVIAPAARWGGPHPEECRDGETDPLTNAGMGRPTP